MVLLLLEKLQESPLLLGGGTFQTIETQVVQEQRGGAVVASNDRTANAGGDAANDSAANAGGHSSDDSAKVFPVESRAVAVLKLLSSMISLFDDGKARAEKILIGMVSLKRVLRSITKDADVIGTFSDVQGAMLYLAASASSTHLGSELKALINTKLADGSSMDRSPVEDSATNHVTEGASQSAAEAVVVGKEPAVLSDAAIVAVPETTSVAVLEATALDSISWKKADTGHTWTQVNTAYSKIVDAARKNRWLATSGKDSVLELAPLVVFLEARSMLGFEKYILGLRLIKQAFEESSESDWMSCVEVIDVEIRETQRLQNQREQDPPPSWEDQVVLPTEALTALDVRDLHIAAAPLLRRVVHPAALDLAERSLEAVLAFFDGRSDGLQMLVEVLGTPLSPQTLKIINWLDTVVNEVHSASKTTILDRVQVEGVKAGDTREVVYEKLFNQFDVDKNGSIDLEEFMQLTRAVQLNVSEVRAVSLFASVDPDASGTLDLTEFVEAMVKFEEMVADDAMKKVGFDERSLVLAIAMAAALLLLLFIFILIGIQAFTTGTSFSAVINSIIPVAASLGLSQQGSRKESGIQNDVVVVASKTTLKV